MSENDLKHSEIKRRNFLTAAGIGFSAIGLQQGCQSISTQNASPSKISPHSLARQGLVTHREMITDIVVAGGGMAGVCAAIAAARNGAKVVLIQDRSMLGGNASSEVRMHIVGADRHGSRNDTDSRESGILEEIRLETAMRNPQRSASVFDLILYEWVLRESNITLMLDTHCYGVEMKSKNRIAAVLAFRPMTEDSFTIHASLFIDCTGDGRLGAEAGAEYRTGREGRGEFGEPLAPPQADNQTMGSSILFMAKKFRRPVPFTPPDWIRRFDGPLPHRGIGSYEYGFWWNEWGGEKDIIKDGEEIRQELLATALGIWNLIKNSGKYKDTENWALDWVGAIPGKRESRRFIGDYVLIEQDVRKPELFEDGVAFGGWNIDLHPPAGIDTSEPPFESHPIPLYNIPYRCLYSRNIDNLFFAGRNISVSHVAFGTTRVMGTCAVAGQAAGTAAALCIQRQCTPRELYRESIAELQQQLLKDDAYIIGISNADPYDLARSASVRASSVLNEIANPSHVINGIHRTVYLQKNCWISDPELPFPQWIELTFPKEQRVREIHLTFDTGLNRQLTLTHSDNNHAHQIWGPQPETVCDYELYVIHGESAKTVADVRGNYQRKRIHRFDTCSASGVRLMVKSTNGAPSARLFEIRVYA